MVRVFSFYKESMGHDDNFFNIYASNSLIFFNIFYRIEILVFIHYI